LAFAPEQGLLLGQEATPSLLSHGPVEGSGQGIKGDRVNDGEKTPPKLFALLLLAELDQRGMGRGNTRAEEGGPGAATPGWRRTH
jgi:hypothetical protein